VCVLYETVTRSARGVEKGPSAGRRMLTAFGGTRTAQGGCEVSLPHCVVAAGLLGTLLEWLCGCGPKPSAVLYVNFLK